MARDAEIEIALLEWAQWLRAGNGDGYARRNVLHPEWSPPSPGMTPTMAVTYSSAAQTTHRQVEQLSVRLRNTVVVHYCVPGLTLEEQCKRLEGIAPSTLAARIEHVHRQLREMRVENAKGSFPP